MVTHEDMISAFYDCRRRKRNTINAVHFEIDFEASVLRLTEAINNRTYYPTRSLAFAVTKPRYREVFAADFSDRVVHHDSYGIRRHVLGMIKKEQFKYFYITDHHCVVRLKKKFTRRAVMIRRVKAGDFWKLSLAEPIALPS